MRIDRIEITNHSRIADLGIDIRRHAVMVGANDVGKSSLLRLLHLLLGATAGQLFQHLTLDDIAAPDKDMVIDVRLIEFTDEERRLFPSEISIDPDDHDESLRIRLTASADPDDPEAVVVRRWFPESGHERGPSRDQLAAFGWRYLPATRGASASAMEGPNSALQTLLQAIDLGEEKELLTNLLSGFNTELHGSVPLTELRTNVASHLSRAMPQMLGADDLAVRTTSDPQNDVLASVSMFLQRDGQHVPLSEQSDGLRQLMSMTLFDLAEGAANIVAIDEPELHLHPASQRTVAELFADSKNQKILATHSPYIVQRFEPSQVIAVSPDGACHQIDDDKLSAVEKQRAQWWSPRLLEVLAARYVVIVEGVSDRIIVEAAARLMDVSLDRIGAVVFELDGADKFRHVYKLVGKAGFSVPVFGLVDEAEKSIWHGAIGGKPTKVFGHTIWVCTPDLEAEYCHALTGPGAARALIDAGHCKEQAVLSSCSTTSLAEIDDNALASFCRKDKVGAAVAIAAQLDLDTVAKLTGVYGLLTKLKHLGLPDD